MYNKNRLRVCVPSDGFLFVRYKVLRFGPPVAAVRILSAVLPKMTRSTRKTARRVSTLFGRFFTFYIIA